MAYVVEIASSADDLTEQMNQMREWLDHARYGPSLFQVYHADAQFIGFRLVFGAKEEAAAFARQFGGHVRNPVIDAGDDPVLRSNAGNAAGR